MKKVMRSGIILAALFYSMNNYANRAEFNSNKSELITEVQNQLIINANNSILLKKSDTFKPIVTIKNNLVYISMLSLDQGPVSVKLYYDLSDNNLGNYELIYKEKFEDQTNISRIYRLDEKKKGEYKIVFKIDGETFIERVEI